MTMNRKTLAHLTPAAAALIAVILAPAPAPAETARQIMEKVDARDDGDNRTAIQEMVLIDRRGNERLRRLRTFSKDKGEDVLRTTFFESPADVRGTGFLTYDYHAGDKDDDQWLYLPELKKTKRIASSDKSSSFMGTDFSYTDLTRRVLDEWTFKLLRESEVRGNKVWLIEAVPASGEIEDRYGYTKSVVFVRQDIFMVVRAVHWVKQGSRLKYLDITRLEQIDGIWIGTEMNMKTTKAKETLHRTILRFQEVKFNQDLDDDLFTVRRIEKGP